MYRAAAKLVTIGRADPTSPINVTPKNIKVYTALANLLREHTTSYEEAYELTKLAVKNEPEWEESHNMMGNCLVKLERYSEAKAAFKRSVSVHVRLMRTKCAWLLIVCFSQTTPLVNTSTTLFTVCVCVQEYACGTPVWYFN